MHRFLKIWSEDRTWWAATGIGAAAWILWDYVTGGNLTSGPTWNPWPILGMIFALFGVGIWFRKRWARWLAAGSFAFCSALLLAGIWYRGFSWFRLLGLACCGYSVWLFLTERFDHEKRSGQKDLDEQDDDKPMLSLILLLKEPQYLEAPILARLASRAWGIEVTGSTDDETSVDEPNLNKGGDANEVESADDSSAAFVVGESPLFLCKHPDAMLMIHNFDAPYFDDVDEICEDIPELRAKQAVRQHRAWQSVDVMAWLGEGDGLTPSYCLIARLLAELADENCLAVVDPDAGMVFVYDPDTDQKLRSADPLQELRNMYYVPVQQISTDDPRLQAAIAEARQRWGEFVQAFEQRTDDALFSVKAPFGDGDEIEFMWVAVGSIENDVIYGKLGNDPVNVRGLKDGDPVRVKVEDMNDWMYVAGDEMVGGFSVKVLMDADKKRRDG